MILGGGLCFFVMLEIFCGGGEKEEYFLHIHYLYFFNTKSSCDLSVSVLKITCL